MHVNVHVYRVFVLYCVMLVGLSAAKLLHKEGIEVLVLEAEDRVGGRLHTARVFKLYSRL